MDYQDTFDPRPFQADVIEQVVDGFATGRKVTVALGTPGTGKTLAYQATATHLLRQGLIDHLAAFAPRLSLARQCEVDWMHQDEKTKELKGHFEFFDQRLHFGKIRHVGTQSPLTKRGAIGTGFVTTYSSLCTAEDVFLEWAEEHRGRFLLVADEAQFCGAPDEKGGGTRAGVLIEQMHEFAAHTLLLTGTPYRADNRPLILSTYSDEDREDGKARLLRDVEATFADGIEQEYLRRFEFQMVDGIVTETDMARTWSQQYSLSAKDVELAKVLRLPTTWQPMVDRVVQSVREKQILNPKYRGLISCMEQREAEAVVNYLRSKYQQLRVFVALSADGKQGQDALQDFKAQPADILVTVRMAFIGYDCKQITVVGVLTHYRHEGHLLQLIGRGLRVWDDEPYTEQSLRVVAPDDERMQTFLTRLKEAEEDGLRRKSEREKAEGGDGGAEQQALSFIEASQMTSVRAVSLDAEVDDAELHALEDAKARVGSPEPVGLLVADPPTSTPLTDAQQIAKIGRQVMEEVRGYLSDRGIYSKSEGYSTYASKVMGTVNKTAGRSAGEVRTIEQAERRLTVIRQMRGRS
jgi:superfamily II DNA or RNA helicase